MEPRGKPSVQMVVLAQSAEHCTPTQNYPGSMPGDGHCTETIFLRPQHASCMHNHIGHEARTMQGEGMKILAGIVAGITLSILAHTFGWRWVAWTMCRIEVLTPIDWTPKTRVWIKGELQDA